MLLGLVRPTRRDRHRARRADRPTRPPTCPASARSSRAPPSTRRSPAPRTCGCSPPSAATTRDRSRPCSSTSGSTAAGDDRYRSYSLGMKQRLGIAAALLGDPELLILDEPANGLDPQGVREMRALVGRLAGTGRTVLVSSHDLSELEQVCDWLVLIDAGRSLYQGPTRELLDGVGRRAGGRRPQRADDHAAAAASCSSARGHEVEHARRPARRARRRRATSATSPRRSTGPRSTPGSCSSSCSPLRTTLEDRYLVDGARRCPMTRIIQPSCSGSCAAARADRRRSAALLFAVVATLAVFAVGRATAVAPADGRARRSPRSPSPAGAPRRSPSARRSSASSCSSRSSRLIATEFSGGTFRALLLRDPHRLRVIVGKLAGILVVAAGVVALAEVLTFVVSLRRRPVAGHRHRRLVLARQPRRRRCATTSPCSAGVAGWAVFGTTLAVIFRSAPLALGVGFAWAGPFENIVVDSWTTGYRVFPGQVLASLIQGGTVELGIGRAVVTAARLHRDRRGRRARPRLPTGRHRLSPSDADRPGARGASTSRVTMMRSGSERGEPDGPEEEVDRHGP